MLTPYPDNDRLAVITIDPITGHTNVTFGFNNSSVLEHAQKVVETFDLDVYVVKLVQRSYANRK